MSVPIVRPSLILLGMLAFSGCGHAPLEPPVSSLSSQAADHAMAMVGKPYHYGGNSPQKGFDCSGLVQYGYWRVGVRLPHGTHHLISASRPISRSMLRRGDLVFFTQEGKKSSHVAIYLGRNQFVHAPSSGKKVYVAELDNPYWQRHFTEARRLILN